MPNAMPLTTHAPKWRKLAKGLPKGAFVMDLHYDYTDNVLVAATFGRGAWTLTGFFPGGTATNAPVKSGARPSQMALGPVHQDWPVNPPLPSEARRPTP